MDCSDILVPSMVTSPADSIRSSRYQSRWLFHGCRSLVMMALLCLVVVLGLVIRSTSARQEDTSGYMPGHSPSPREACGPGMYSASPTVACVTCNPGSITEIGARSGVVSSNATTCTPCGPGMYSASPTVACTMCNPGSITEIGARSGVVSSNATTCTPCDPGMYSASPTVACVSFPDAYVVTVQNLGGEAAWKPPMGIAEAHSPTFFSGIYQRVTTGHCSGRPVYTKGRDDAFGTALILAEMAPRWGGHAPGLHWTLRFKASGGFTEPFATNDTECRGPYTIHVMGNEWSVNDDEAVAGWASGCEEHPDAPNCTWHANFITNMGQIQVLAANSCTYASCGQRASSCFKVPAAARLPAAKCDAPPIWSAVEVRTPVDTGCVGCTCDSLDFLGQQYCTRRFEVTGTRNPRYSGDYSAVKDCYCNQKPVFQMFHHPDDGSLRPDDGIFAPVLYQPTDSDWWAIADGWTRADFALAAQDTIVRNDHCPDHGFRARSPSDACPLSPDSSGCVFRWTEEGKLSPTLKVVPHHYYFAPSAPKYCRPDRGEACGPLANSTRATLLPVS
jgi:hypothetical protein